MKRWIILTTAIAALVLVPQISFTSINHALTFSVASVCLLLWISEIVPLFVPTLLLWAGIPLIIGRVDAELGLGKVLGWAADPVVALFFGGFVLGVAAERAGLAQRLMRFAIRRSGKSYHFFLLLVVIITAVLSMWMSNIAAAALVLASLRPLLSGFELNDVLRRTILIGVALGADLGGIATPIGTGPNAIAIASVSASQPISFLAWMAFAFPLTVGMIGAGYVLLVGRIPKTTDAWKKNTLGPIDDEAEGASSDKSDGRFSVLLGIVILCWITEPLHGVPAGIVSLASAVAVFAFRFLTKDDLIRIDWSTLLLIMGGITLGRLLEHSGIIKQFSAGVPFHEFDPVLSLFILCLISAFLSALMSNTATVILLIPIATAFMPHPSTAILVAIAASFGVPFVISTPPNAMAYGEGGLRFSDLFWPGTVLMIGGCLLIAVTGRPVLKLAGID